MAARLEEEIDGVVGSVGQIALRSGGSAQGRPSARLVGEAVPHAQQLAEPACLGYQTNNESIFLLWPPLGGSIRVFFFLFLVLEITHVFIGSH